MLSELNIHGLAIIDRLSIQFTPGFNVITGETGAGKSILIKALGLLLGAKASAETVRRGRDTGSVSGQFEVPSGHASEAVLERYDIPIEKDDEGFPVLVRRSISAKGRSQAWINDVPVTIGTLRELAASLIDVFAQHENQKLLDPNRHRNYLDRFLSDVKTWDTFHELYKSCTDQLTALRETLDEYASKERGADYLRFRCEELREFSPSREDYDQVKDLCHKGEGMVSFVEKWEQIQGLVDQGAGGEPLSKPLWDASRLMEQTGGLSEDMAAIASDAADLASRVDDLSYQVGRVGSGFELDESELEEAQTRLSGYQDLFRKLGVEDIDGLCEEKDRLERELSFLDSVQEDVTERLKKLSETATQVAKAAEALTAARKKAAKTVKKRIEGELHELAMPGSRLDVTFDDVRKQIPDLPLAGFGDEAAELWSEAAEALASVTEAGAERVQFLLASNPGEPALPLQKVASGGEISRIMLALKKGLAAGADTCILVFDEIDTGISGRVADVVGKKMKTLADSFQVVCISHLAQVAAYAQTHFRVSKKGKKGRTESTIERLESSESVEEIARLLSGDEVTSSSKANARHLIKKAHGARTG